MIIKFNNEEKICEIAAFNTFEDQFNDIQDELYSKDFCRKVTLVANYCLRTSYGHHQFNMFVKDLLDRESLMNYLAGDELEL